MLDEHRPTRCGGDVFVVGSVLVAVAETDIGRQGDDRIDAGISSSLGTFDGHLATRSSDTANDGNATGNGLDGDLHPAPPFGIGEKLEF